MFGAMPAMKSFGPRARRANQQTNGAGSFTRARLEGKHNAGMGPAESENTMRYIHNITHEYDSTYQATTTHETAVTLYTFDELNNDARARVVADYIEERENDPYFSQWFADFQEHEIWQCVRDLEKSITGARVQWRYNRWYSCDFDCEFSYDDCYDPGELEPVRDNGYYASMDICDAWNKHVRKLNAINSRVDHLYTLEDGLYDAGYMELLHVWNDKRRPLRPGAQWAHRYDCMRGELITAWYAELEAACEDVRDTIETLLRVEWEDYTSAEYAREECADESTQGGECRTCEYPYWSNGGYTGRVYYSDNRKWYTVDGVFFEQSNINHECVSLALAS